MEARQTIRPQSSGHAPIRGIEVYYRRTFEDVPDDLVRTVQAPTLIVLGDQDIVRLEHAVELTHLIAASRLLIVPGGHGDYIGEAVMTQKKSRYPELTAGLVQEFLDAP